MQARKLLTIYFAMAVGISSCAMPSSEDDSPVLARVQNATLTLDKALKEIPRSVLEQDSVNSISSYTEQWIHTQVAIQEAERIGLANAPGIQEKMNRIRGQILEDALSDYILSEHADELEVTREEAQNYFQAYKDQFALEERYIRFRHLTTRTRTEADNAKRDLMRGISWQDVVNEYSVNSELQFRESTQFWPISMAAEDIPIMNRYLRIIGITEISPIQNYGGRFHFVQLREERAEGANPDLDWLIPQIVEWLKLDKARRIANGYIRNLYLESEANNEIDRATVTEIESLLSTANRN